MIRNQWYAILDSKEVKPGRPIGVTRMGEKLVLWRDQSGEVVCQRDLCAHRGAALSAGRLVDNHVECPFHGFQYDSSGRCQYIPALGRGAPVPERFQVATYPTAETHGFVYLWWGEPRDELPDVPFFDNIDDSFTYAGRRDPWPTHYSRAIENQLDAMHLPFVHHNTIGRGERTLVHGPRVEWKNDDHMYVYVYNQVDDGSSPLRPEEVPIATFHLEFRFPNLWQNHISDQVRVVAAFVPIDKENTRIYLRFYQNFMRLPILRHLVTRMAMPFNMVVLHQDRRVVRTQRPLRTELRMGENLVQGDRPIVAYRRRRQELLDERGQP